MEMMQQSKTFDSEKEAFSLIEKVVHQVLTEALESPITEIKLKNAYDTLHTCCRDSIQFQDEISVETIPVFCDFYRAFLVVSFLLRLEGSYQLNVQSYLQTLEDSVERSIVLLQVLAAAPSEEDLVNRLPPSKYPLLNSIFSEPLIPLSLDERKAAFSSYSDHDAETVNTVFDDSDHILSIPSKRQLALEEKELLEIASIPILTNTQTITTDMHANDPIQVSHLLKMPHDVLVEDQNVQFHRCGILDFGSTKIQMSTHEANNIKVFANFVEIQLNGGRCINVPLAYSTCQDWKEAIDTVRNHIRTQELLRRRALDLWNNRNISDALP
jgi:hypothetical protein